MILISYILLLNFVFIQSQNLSYNGFGLNILSNEFKLPIFDINSECQVIQPTYESSGKNEMEEYEILYSYSNIETKSINLKLGIKGLFGGSFSTSYTKKKEILKKFNSVTIRTSRIFKRNTLLISNCQLISSFKEKIYNIAHYINTNNQSKAFEFIQTLVRDYGTHVITKSVVGGYLLGEINVDSAYYKQLISSDKITSLASNFFFKKFKVNFGISSSVSETMVNDFESKSQYETFWTQGGRYTTNGGITDWENSILNNIDLAIVEVDGHSIDEVFAPEYFNDISTDILNIIKIHFNNIVDDFYSRNKIVGCMSPYYLSYDNNANFHSPDMCNNNPKENEYYFGGSILIEKPLHDGSEKLFKPNIITQTKYCPLSFKNFSIIVGNRIDFWNRYYKTELIFCASTFPPTKLVYFAGGFSADINNFVTNNRYCPKNFKPLNLEKSDNYICESDIETQDTIILSVPFGGLIFKNNFVGLNQTTTQRCPSNLEPYPIFITQDKYTVYVCSKLKNDQYEVVLLKEPPFADLLPIFIEYKTTSIPIKLTTTIPIKQTTTIPIKYTKSIPSNNTNKLTNLFLTKIILNVLIIFVFFN